MLPLHTRVKKINSYGRRLLGVHIVTLTLVILLFLAGVFSVLQLGKNPPGFYIDEASICFNAHTVSQTGRDEFDNSWPLFFRAFGDYKNPVYIYLLAALFKITGPSNLAARLLSAASGIITALLLGLLAVRITKRRDLGLLVTLTALLTPWFFEISRVVLEVALYPIVLTLFLLCVHWASTRARWSWREPMCLAGTLALVTYTYSIGRLLGPLLAMGLFFFAARSRRAGIILFWSLYALTLIPILVFRQRHPGALTDRFSIITYISPQSTPAQIIREFVKHFFGNFNPWRLLVTGDPDTAQIVHLHGAELLLVTTFVLAVAGLWMVLRHHRHEAWWRFIIYGLVVCTVPAALTNNYVHMLRLAPLPVFLSVLTIPALEWLWREGKRRRLPLALTIVLTILQGGVFQWRYHISAHTRTRKEQFDNGYPEKIFSRAVASPSRPIYLADAPGIPGYIQAYWNATLRQIPYSEFVRLPPNLSPPASALVITTDGTCSHCQIIAISEFYTLYETSPDGKGKLITRVIP